MPHLHSSAAFSLGFEGFWTDLHFHPFEGVVGSMPTIPTYAIHVLLVLTLAVVHPIEIGISAAVVPVATWYEKHMRIVGWGCPP